MMNKQIRRMIDEIFADMKMTADNLALRDELMANAQARFEDSVRAGKTEEEAFAEVAASLGDVQSLLREMNAEKPEDSAEETAQTETQTQSDETAEGEEAGADEPDFEVKTEKTPDIGEALGKAFGALGDVGKQIVPQAQKLVRQVDDLTGGVIGGIGKAVGKGLSDAQKAAGKAIDKLSGDKGEIVIDFGEGKPKAPAALRERARPSAPKRNSSRRQAIRRARGNCARRLTRWKPRPTTWKRSSPSWPRRKKPHSLSRRTALRTTNLTRFSTRWTRCRKR